MNIGIFFTHDYSLKSWYETGTLDKELKIYRNLSKEYKVNFVFYTYGDSEDIKILPNETGMKVFPIYDKFKRHNNKYVRLLFTFFLPFRIKKYTEDLDIIQQHQLAGVWVSLIIKLLIKKPLYMRTGYDTYQFSLKENKPFLLILFYKFMTYCSLKYSDVYSVTSNSDIKFLEQNFKTKPKKLVLRPNWVDDNKTSTSDRFSYKILSVGRLEKQKNIIGAIKAFEKVQKKWSNLKYIIIGSGSEELKIKNYIKEKNLQKKIILKGYINPQRELKYSKILILNSLYEGQPNILLESINYNLPIISTKCLSGPDEILMNGKYGELVPVDNYEALSKKIDFVLKNYNRAITKSKKGIPSLSRFNLINQCKKYKSFLENVNYE